MAENERQCFAHLTADKFGVIHYEQEHAIGDIIIIILLIKTVISIITFIIKSTSSFLKSHQEITLPIKSHFHLCTP
jgi:hypothetical protein